MKYHLKTKKAASKRLKIKANILIRKKAFKQHLLRKKSAKRLRNLNIQVSVNKADIKKMKQLLPNN